MGKYKISVVVPVYKAENFLRMCVDSILQQTLKSSRLFKSLQIERSLLSLCCENQDKHSSHVRSTGQRYNKI